MGEEAGITEPGLAERIETAVEGLGLPTRPDARLDPEALLSAVRQDKKRARGNLHVPLPVRVGESRIAALDETRIRGAIAAIG